MDVLNWVEPQVLFVRLHDTRERGYREKVVTDRPTASCDSSACTTPRELARVVLTPEREVAQLWQCAPDSADRLAAPAALHAAQRAHDHCASTATFTTAHDDREIACFIHDLLQHWKRPDATIARAQRSRRRASGKTRQRRSTPAAKFIGPVWVGAGRNGRPPARPSSAPPSCGTIPARARRPKRSSGSTSSPPTRPPSPQLARSPPSSRTAKRLFDIGCSIIALL